MDDYELRVEEMTLSSRWRDMVKYCMNFEILARESSIQNVDSTEILSNQQRIFTDLAFAHRMQGHFSASLKYLRMSFRAMEARKPLPYEYAIFYNQKAKVLIDAGRLTEARKARVLAMSASLDWHQCYLLSIALEHIACDEKRHQIDANSSDTLSELSKELKIISGKRRRRRQGS